MTSIPLADFDEVYKTKPCNLNREVPKPVSGTFIASYPPVSKPGTEGAFFVNSQQLQPNRYAELLGPVPIRSDDFRC